MLKNVQPEGLKGTGKVLTIIAVYILISTLLTSTLGLAAAAFAAKSQFDPPKN